MKVTPILGMDYGRQDMSVTVYGVVHPDGTVEIKRMEYETPPQACHEERKS